MARRRKGRKGRKGVIIAPSFQIFTLSFQIFTPSFPRKRESRGAETAFTRHTSP